MIRDNNLTEAAEFATILVNSTNDLDTKVNDTSLFNSDVAFAGMMALANEVWPHTSPIRRILRDSQAGGVCAITSQSLEPHGGMHVYIPKRPLVCFYLLLHRFPGRHFPPSYGKVALPVLASMNRRMDFEVKYHCDIRSNSQIFVHCRWDQRRWHQRRRHGPS